MDFNATGWMGPVAAILFLYGLGSMILDIARVLG